MDYQALINETKQKIDNYSFDDSAYNEIYEKAKTKLTNAYNTGTKEINRSLGDARKKAVEDNALATKSLQEALALRGLARSGESAMLKMNQQLSLSNALARISGEAVKSQGELYAQHQKELANLSTELGKQKTSAMESEKSVLYDRLSELEKLKADEDKWKTTLYATTNKNNSSSGTSSGEKNEEKKDNSAAIIDGFVGGLIDKDGVTPDISAEKTAKNILTTCGVDDGVIRSSVMQQRVYKELARIICSGDYSKAYSTELLNVLRSHGFNMDFDIELARSTNVKYAYRLYQSTFSDYYNWLVLSDLNVNEAAVRAKTLAQKRVVSMLKAKNLPKKTYNSILTMLWMLD